MTTRELQSETGSAGPYVQLFARALGKRRTLLQGGRTRACRVFSGDSEGLSGVFIDVYGPGAAMMVYEGRTPRGLNVPAAANDALAALTSAGVTSVYVKPFPKDRPKLGGEMPAQVTSPEPASGVALDEAIIVREVDWNLEVRLYDGLSTGLFLDQRENRAALAQAVRRRAGKTGQPASVLNTFAYTCAFSVACAMGGASTTSVDVSARYLDWGKRNFAHNALALEHHRFARMDTFEFFAYARRKGLRYDLVILDPPSFAAGNKKKGIRAFSSLADYAKLVREAKGLLSPGGAIFASTNTQDLCKPAYPGGPIRLELEIAKGLGLPPARTPRWLELPGAAPDFAMERERFAARFFTAE